MKKHFRFVAAMVAMLAFLLPAARGQQDAPKGAKSPAATQPARERPLMQKPAAPRVPPGVKAYRDLAYAEGEGASHKLDLYVPEKTASRPPLLAWIHGGGWTKGSKSALNPALLRLTAEGYAAASIEYRLTGIQSHPNQIQDCKGAIRWLRANADKYGYDASRIGVAGGSAGGHLVLLLGTSGDVKELEGDIGGNLDQSSRVQAVVDLFGPADLTLFAKNSERFAQSGIAERAKSASPVTYISKDDPPLLILHGDRDPLVPLKQSEEMDRLYREAGLESTLHVIKGAVHGGPQFSDPTRYEMIKAFFDKHIKQLKDAPAPATPPAATEK